MNFHPVENAKFAGRPQSGNPRIVGAVTQLNA